MQNHIQKLVSFNWSELGSENLSRGWTDNEDLNEEIFRKIYSLKKPWIDEFSEVAKDTSNDFEITLPELF